MKLLLGYPIRLAGIIRLYSNNAIPQLDNITILIDNPLYFKCQYHANVINKFEKTNKPIVTIGVGRKKWFISYNFTPYLKLLI